MATTPKETKNRFDEIYSQRHFYEQYDRKYPKTMFGFKKGIRPVKISKQLHRKIILEYWDIYFKELYFNESKSYFLFGGTLQLILYPERMIKAPDLKFKPASIGFFWYQRPSVLFHKFIKFIKLTGSSNRLPKIENIFKKNQDIDLIITFDKAIKSQLKNLYHK